MTDSWAISVSSDGYVATIFQVTTSFEQPASECKVLDLKNEAANPFETPIARKLGGD